MKSPARKHHYLPQGYLAAFTDTGEKDGQFNVLDITSGNCFRTSPKNVAAERDFNRIDVEGKPPDVLEQALSPFEDRAIQACRTVNLTQAFPNDEDHNYLLNLLGLIAVRNPQLRTSFNRARLQSIHVLGGLLISDERTWKHHLKKAREAGYVGENEVPFEEMKQFIEERRYTIEFAPEGNLRAEFHAFDGLLPLLGERFWSVLVAPDPGPGFICSDHPVTLTWKKSSGHGPIGYASKNTEVFFPIGHRTGFYGVYEEPLRTVITMEAAQIAVMNRRVADSSERHVYSKTGTFIIKYQGKVREVACQSNSASSGPPTTRSN